MDSKIEKKNAIIFAAFSLLEELSESIPEYLAELKRHTDYLVYVSDNDKLSQKALDTINQYADKIILKRHGKYDFGSYQLGFNHILENESIYNNLDRIFFCNDSVIYLGFSLEPFFKKSENTHFYGLTWHSNGFFRCETPEGVTYPWGRFPHIQTYLFSVSKEIADNQKFRDFMNNIQHEQCKEDIIVKYEIGLSRMITESLGYKMESYYPQLLDVNPCGYFLSPESSYKGQVLFLKRIGCDPVILETDVDVEQ